MGKSIFNSQALLAPMAGITDLPFRTIARQNGLKYGFTEMLAVKPLLTKTAKSLLYLKTNKDDRPLGAQIVGSDGHMLAEAAQRLQEEGFFSSIDINFGCPVNKVVKKGEGSALLKKPKKIAAILKKVVAAVDIPVTCKIRIGWDQNSINAITIAKTAQDSGAQAITVHSRTKDAGYSGLVNMNIIKEVKQSVSIPVIGNGNIFCLEDAISMLKETGCDHVMVARGALGNPWIFDEIENRRHSHNVKDIISVRDTLLQHAQLLVDFYGERKAVLLLRKVGCWYFKWFSGKAQYKLGMSKITSYDSFLQIVCDYVENAQT